MGRAVKLGLPLGMVSSLILAAVAVAFVRPTQDPSISGTPRVGAVLKCNPGTWDGPVTSFSYSWSLLSDTGNGGSGNPFATGQSWQADQAHVNQDIVCNVTAQASDGTTTTAESHYVTIQPLHPNPCVGALRAFYGTSSQGLQVEVDLTNKCVSQVFVTYRPRCTGKYFRGRSVEFSYDSGPQTKPVGAGGRFKLGTSHRIKGWAPRSREIAVTTGLVSGHGANGTFSAVSRFYYTRNKLAGTCVAPRSLRWSAHEHATRPRG